MEPVVNCEIIKEDCDVQVDDSSYGGWLIIQGIDLHMSPSCVTPIIISPTTAHKIAADNMETEVTDTGMQTDIQNDYTVPGQSKVKENLDPLPQVELPKSPSENEDANKLDKDDRSYEALDVQSLTEHNYLLQMQTLIYSRATQKQYIEQIQKLKQILNIMESIHKPYPQPVQRKPKNEDFFGKK